MNGWCILGLVLAALALLLAVPVGIQAAWDGAPVVKVRAGPFRFQVFPGREKKEEEPPKEKKKDPSKKKKKKRGISLEQVLYSLQMLPPLVGKLLRLTCRGLRVDPLLVHITAAGPDPADAAVLYGRLYGAIATLLPLARELVPIRHEDVTLRLDFEKSALEAEADVGVYLRLGHLLGIGLVVAGGGLLWLLGFLKRAKPPKAEPEDQAENESAKERSEESKSA